MKKASQIFLCLTALTWITGCSLFGGGDSDTPVSIEPGSAGTELDITQDEGFAEFDSPDDYFFSDDSFDDEGMDFGASEQDFFAQELEQSGGGIDEFGAAGDAVGSESDFNDFEVGFDDAFAESGDSFADSGAGFDDTGFADSGFDEGAGDAFADDYFADDFAPAPSGFNEVTNIEYLATQGTGTLVIETAQPVTYRTRRNPAENQVVLELPGVQLPKKFERPYITRDFQQDIANVTAYYDPPTGETRVVVQLAADARFNVEAQGSRIVLTPGETALGTSSRTAEAMPQEDTRESAFGPQSSSEDMANHMGDVLNFKGKPINIEVDDGEVRDVLRMIAEQAGINLIVDEMVQGKISLKLREVPWDQALALILKTKQFGFARQGSVLRITTQDRLAEEQAKQRRLLDERVLGEPIRVRVVTVSYAQVEELKDKVESVLSQRGKVVVDPRTASLVISDVEEYLERADRLVKSLDVVPRQVLIEGKVVEARETFSREIGVNFSLAGTSFESGNVGFNLNTRNSPAASGIFADGLGMDLTAGTFENIGDLNAFLGLREKEEKINVISSPRVVTLNNKEAEITQKTQIPIVTVQPGTPPTYTTEFKDIQLLLKVLPQITFEGNVILDVNVLREFPDARTVGGQDMAINSRSATTSVLVPNGQTAVIGGIYQSDIVESETGIPFLKDIPLLGNLFKHRGREHSKNELLIFLTPRILQNHSASPQKLLSEAP